MVGKSPSYKARRLYEPLDFIMLRAPALSIEEHGKIRGYLESGSVNLDPEDALSQRVSHAIAISSPSLLQRIEESSRSTKSSERIAGKALRFATRMTMRATPYGAFAGVAIAGWDTATSVILNPEPRMWTRPDMGWLLSFVRSIDAKPFLRNQLNWVMDSGGWRHGSRIFVERLDAASSDNGQREISIAATRVV